MDSIRLNTIYTYKTELDVNYHLFSHETEVNKKMVTSATLNSFFTGHLFLQYFL